MNRKKLRIGAKNAGIFADPCIVSKLNLNFRTIYLIEKKVSLMQRLQSECRRRWLCQDFKRQNASLLPNKKSLKMVSKI